MNPPEDSCLQSALRILAARGHSEAELLRKLLSRGFDRAATAKAVEYCRARGYLDDRLFAGDLVGALASRNLGRRRIALELHKRGVPPALAAEALDALDRDDELRRACEALEVKLRLSREADRRKLRMSCLRFLAGRGFSQECCIQAVARALSSE